MTTFGRHIDEPSRSIVSEPQDGRLGLPIPLDRLTHGQAIAVLVPLLVGSEVHLSSAQAAGL